MPGVNLASRDWRLQKKSRYVTVDVCFQWHEYHGVDLAALRRLVFEREAAAICACTERVKRESIEFDFVLFENDVASALDEIRVKWLLT